MEGISPMVEPRVVGAGVMDAPPSVAAVSHKNWLVFEHNWSRHSPSLSWWNMSIRERKGSYPNDKAVLAVRACVVRFPVKEVCIHPRNNCTSSSWISSFPECASARLDPSPGALGIPLRILIQVGGSQVGLFPTTCLAKQFHDKVILTLAFNTCQVTSWNKFYDEELPTGLGNWPYLAKGPHRQ